MTGAHVLVVEDDLYVSDAIRLMLEARGYRVSQAHSVAEGRSALDTDAPAMALLDLTLPDGTGLAVARHARQAGLTCVMIALTGHEPDEVGDDCRAAGCVQVLQKPIPLRQLADTVALLLG
jgi:DNA-binding response OmpR family regulator